MKLTGLDDVFVLYFHEEDQAWVSHAITYDQIGVDKDAFTAIQDGAKAIKQVEKVAAEDPQVQLKNLAPQRILDMMVESEIVSLSMLARVAPNYVFEKNQTYLLVS